MATVDWPRGQELLLSTSDNKITIHPQVQTQGCPAKVMAFLYDLGWSQSATHPDTSEPLWQKHGEPDTDGMYYKWYEAVSYEFYKFVTLSTGNEI